MNEPIRSNEHLIRAVYPPDRKPSFWENGHISSAALKDRYGLSVDRTLDRSLSDAIYSMKQRLHGYMVSFTVQQCNAVNAYINVCPSNTNKYHCQIQASETELELTDYQARKLALTAQIHQ